MIISLLRPAGFALAGFFLSIYLLACAQTAQPAAAKRSNRHAENFSIEQKEGYQLLTIYQPWRNASQPIQYALVPRQQPTPTLPAAMQTIAVPVQKIICTSTVQVAMLEFIGQTEKIVGLSDGKYLYNEQVFARLQKGQIADLGSDNQLDFEKALALRADLCLVFGLDAPSKTAQKLQNLGQPSLYVSEFMENSPLGRAEWVKLVAALFGDSVQRRSERLFIDSVETPYLQIVQKLPKNPKKPTVFTGVAYEGSWFVAGGRSFLAQLIADAGGDYLYKSEPSAGGLPLAVEKVYADCKQADIWLNVSEAGSLWALQMANPLYENFAAFGQKRVFSYHKRISANGGFDIFESAVLRPHLILQDFYRIFQQPEVVSDSLYYYQRLQ